MLNRIILMGRLTRDPELRHTQTGTPVASFSLAVDRDFKDKTTGEKSTDFIDIVAWRQTAEFVSRFFTKGRMAVVEGRLQLRDWTDRDGNKRRTAEVIADNVYFGDLEATVRRNAYGRQLGSFASTADFGDIKDFPLVFIRGPFVSDVGADATIETEVDGRVVGLRQGNILATAFHPELTDDTRIHELFLSL